MDIKFDSEMHVDLIDFMGSDQRVVQAAQVSTKGADSVNSEAKEGLIRYLVNNRHASPVEHSVFTFLISAPMYVAMESNRHRMSSVNAESTRYKEMNARFYLPSPDRKIVQIGKTGDYKFSAGTQEQYDGMIEAHTRVAKVAWEEYERQLSLGIAKELAARVIPPTLYVSWYLTLNARSLMNYLSLRTTNPDATIKSSPQREIEMVAEKMETHFEELMPLTYKAWHNNGRKAI